MERPYRRREATLTHQLKELRHRQVELANKVHALTAANLLLKHEQLVERLAVLRVAHDELEKRVDLFGRSHALQAEEYPTRNSYSIEAEDLLIETIFRTIIRQFVPGTYLDIGAAHPIDSSNTYYFYKRGWRGFCVEPNPDLCRLFERARPEDDVFNFGIASDSGIFRYHRFEHALINGFYDQDLVDWHTRKNGQVYLGYSDVPCQRIDEFLAKHVNRPIDLLSIDIETMDAEILRAWRWDLCRPTVICAEIHASDAKDALQSPIAAILEQAGYSMVCRGWLSAIFVLNERLKDAIVIGR
ncbi:FkbM family methyltransferase [Bradyrhizobium sp. U87765 SZCCT0131]|uniref:FkbM family methyltransferase n=1 Tax=unclassified Bradyrhizobium TaxID=2631580 RepID=UPI001BA61FF8|nr:MULTISPECIES: FkbM family methyltransferase [unclassified Bradyrhizobium]MBR1219668.1 FkbM family methyltransferase [Bradyrhizobium sp. U87765 SZCCT0131]MBR1262319.1 FkbM family methyltransferase [Bradyrhizobium sp. U87765 SZCCT0134]MBR1308498.1 FkbM family methyltransferase [Bradyrhizobium sp. U87765 SZCCT0110]MBR1318101.1 FkbM family methyltransferase [Bradyrhizobium sp. U87765 SZCCT0109]MBR1351804.1 FkbM family methyltransferase [Bradyrhizobium sp. U87765 SZCCT0048]